MCFLDAHWQKFRTSIKVFLPLLSKCHLHLSDKCDQMLGVKKCQNHVVSDQIFILNGTMVGGVKSAKEST